MVTFGLRLCKVFPETNRLRKLEGLKAESTVLTEDNKLQREPYAVWPVVS